MEMAFEKKTMSQLVLLSRSGRIQVVWQRARGMGWVPFSLWLPSAVRPNKTISLIPPSICQTNVFQPLWRFLSPSEGDEPTASSHIWPHSRLKKSILRMIPVQIPLFYLWLSPLVAAPGPSFLHPHHNSMRFCNFPAACWAQNCAVWDFPLPRTVERVKLLHSTFTSPAIAFHGWLLLKNGLICQKKNRLIFVK